MVDREPVRGLPLDVMLVGKNVEFDRSSLFSKRGECLEREKMLGTGSTGRNAGGVRHQFSNEANIRLSIESIGLLARFADEVGHPIDFHQDGYLFLLSTPASVETFKRNVALQRSLGVDVQWLDGADAARLAPGLDAGGVVGAVLAPVLAAIGALVALLQDCTIQVERVTTEESREKSSAVR